MRALCPLIAAILAFACATQTRPPPETKVEYVSQRVEISVPVRCKVAFPERPAYALEDPALKDKTAFDNTPPRWWRSSSAEKLEAALKACADPE
jgi:hypothetical protein